MISQYFAPTKVIFGQGAENEVGTQLEAFGAQRVLLIYGGHSAEKSGLLGKVRSILNEHGIYFHELGGVKPNPRISLAREGVKIFADENLDFILAVGGGSVIDTAKAVGYGVFGACDPWDFYCGKRVPAGSAPVGVILTMAAAGSEMSDSSVLTNEDGGLKRGCNSDYCRVKFALMNPELTYTVPDYQTSCGTVDIIMHTLERYFHAGKGLDFTDDLSFALIRSVIENGNVLHKNPVDYDGKPIKPLPQTLALISKVQKEVLADNHLCPNCITPTPAGAKFCTSCGTKVAVWGTCKTCQKVLTGGNYCADCGTKNK